jgi:hypothetical protein
LSEAMNERAHCQKSAASRSSGKPIQQSSRAQTRSRYRRLHCEEPRRRAPSGVTPRFPQQVIELAHSLIGSPLARCATWQKSNCWRCGRRDGREASSLGSGLSGVNPLNEGLLAAARARRRYRCWGCLSDPLLDTESSETPRGVLDAPCDHLSKRRRTSELLIAGCQQRMRKPSRWVAFRTMTWSNSLFSRPVPIRCQFGH